MPLLMLAACEGGGPTQPTAPSSPPGLAFEVAGVVTDERGATMPGATVTMGYWLGGFLHRPSALTDSSGSYRFSFTANPLGNGFVAEPMWSPTGTKSTWRSVMRSTGTHFIHREHSAGPDRADRCGRIDRAVGPARCRRMPQGGCAELCPIVRVTVPAEGRVSIEVHRVGQSGDLPPVEVCCVNGDEQSGNPSRGPRRGRTRTRSESRTATRLYRTPVVPGEDHAGDVLGDRSTSARISTARSSLSRAGPCLGLIPPSSWTICR